MSKLVFSVHIEPMRGGGFLATIPAIPECQTTAKTFDSSIAKITRLLKAHLRNLAKAGKPIVIEQQKFRPLCLPIRVNLTRGAQTVLASRLMSAA